MLKKLPVSKANALGSRDKKIIKLARLFLFIHITSCFNKNKGFFYINITIAYESCSI